MQVNLTAPKRIQERFYAFTGSSQIRKLIIFVFYTFAIAWLAHEIGYEVGYVDGRGTRRACAKVEGETVISSNADTCTYARAWGVAVWKRKAL